MKKIHHILFILLAGLLLTLAACSHAEDNTLEGNQTSLSTDAEISSDSTQAPSSADSSPAGAQTNAVSSSEGASDDSAPETDEADELSTIITADPDDLVMIPDLKESDKIILSLKDGKILGAASSYKAPGSGIIKNYKDFQELYGAAEGIDETFFETHDLKLVHTAQSSSSTRYAVESVTLENGTVKVEVLELLAAMATRDLRYWYVFAAVEKSQADSPVETQVTTVQVSR